MRTAEEMQKLRSMVRVANRAYQELTGTLIGQMANWPSTQQFFSTIGFNKTTKYPSNKKQGGGYRRGPY